jgi:hypothetical protein
MPLPYYAFGLRQVSLTNKQSILIASPEKSLCDKIIATSGVFLRSKKQTIQFLIEDLRISELTLRDLNTSLLEEWAPKAPKSSSIQMLTTTLKSLNK